MAVFQSDVLESGRPALGGMDKGTITDIVSISVPSTAVAGDDLEITAIDSGAKLIWLRIEDPDAMFAAAFADLRWKNAGTAIKTGVAEGTTWLLGAVPNQDDVLILRLTAAPANAGNLVVAVQFTYE